MFTVAGWDTRKQQPQQDNKMGRAESDRVRAVQSAQLMSCVSFLVLDLDSPYLLVSCFFRRSVIGVFCGGKMHYGDIGMPKET